MWPLHTGNIVRQCQDYGAHHYERHSFRSFRQSKIELVFIDLSNIKS